MSGDAKSAIAARFLDSFLREIVLDTAILTNAKIKRARSICHLCGVRCQAHTSAAQQSSLSALDAAPSRSGTPVPGGSAPKPDYYSNNPLFECLVCSRQVSSNRYATHLAKCMGMGSKGGRKGAARNAKATSATPVGRGAGTPRYSSDADDDSLTKRKNGLVKGTKRANSPLAPSSVANARMNKRIKTSSPTPPPAEGGGGLNRTFSSQTFAPSGLSNSTVLSGSPLNPNHTGTASNGAGKKRKRLIDDDEEEDDGGESYHEASDGESNEEEGEISDDDVALAAGSTPRSGGTKIKIPLRSTPSSTGSAKPKTSGLQRERGSDGEFIDVESASEQSDNDSF
uniref:SAGA-associated factor 11 n=1 Tax=Kalmanozyma brasiliensis (strain GHG001) TaxID=1365824 RepID=V5ERY2_KALBG